MNEEFVVLSNKIVKYLNDATIVSRLAHWNVRGSNFYEAHLMFERVYNDLADLMDDLIEQLRAQGHEVFDHGPEVYDALDDYPAFCINAALAVVRDEQASIAALGIVLGGSGNGEQIAANKVHGIRAALAWNESTAKLAREHNNANVVAIGARQHSREEVLRLVEIFIAEPFSFDERHVRRIGQIANYEQSGEVS
jgi:ribose 5-phosphate isomerase B